MKNLLPIVGAVLTALTFAFIPSIAKGQLISVNFTIDSGDDISGKAVLGKAGDTWNNLSDLFSADYTITNLKNSADANSGVSLEGIDFGGHYSGTSYDNFVPALFNDLYSSQADDSELKLTHLADSHAYELVFYAYNIGADGNTEAGVNGEDIDPTVDGTTHYLNGYGDNAFYNVTNLDGSQTGNYLVFDAESSSTGELDIKVPIYTNVTGFQVMAVGSVPEPSTTPTVLLGSGLLLLALYLRRRPA